MSEISEEDPIKISEQFPKAFRKFPDTSRSSMCFAEKASLPGFWFEIRIFGGTNWLRFFNSWKFISETEYAFEKSYTRIFKVKLANLIFKNQTAWNAKS